MLVRYAQTGAWHTQSSQVASSIVQAIKLNRAEVIVNQNVPTEILTKVLYLFFQLFPRLGDYFYKWIGLTVVNRQRVRRLGLREGSA